MSARLTISALESVISAAERRALRTGEDRTTARIADLFAVVPAITGKIELVYEGEQEGPEKVANHLLGLAVRNTFKEVFPDPAKPRKPKAGAPQRPTPPDPYAPIVAWFDEHQLDLMSEADDATLRKALDAVPGLRALVQQRRPGTDAAELPVWMEFVLHGLAEHSRIGRTSLVRSVRFGDVLGSVLGGITGEDE